MIIFRHRKWRRVASYDASITLKERGPRCVFAVLHPGRLINLAGGHVSIEHGLMRPNHAVVTAYRSAPTPSATPFRLVAFGDADVTPVAGGAESAANRFRSPALYACRVGDLLQRRLDLGASRPWPTRDRDGF